LHIKSPLVIGGNSDAIFGANILNPEKNGRAIQKNEYIDDE